MSGKAKVRSGSRLMTSAIVLTALTMSLSGCFWDKKTSNQASQGTGTGTTGTTATPPPATPPPPTPANSAPTITGTPATVAKAGVPYAFQPSATDQDGDKLTFTIAGKPGWAAFDPTTGMLSGVPADGATGTYANIQITVSDGKAQTSLPAFSITVSAPVIGSATLSWARPATNEDGSTLTNLSGYVIRYGQDPSALDQKIALNNAGLTTVVIENLVQGTWYFTVASVNATGVESRPTGYVSKTIS